MLPPRWVLRQEAVDRARLAERLDQLDLGVGGVDEAHLHPLRRQIERRVDLRRPHHVPVEGDRRLYRRSRHADMVEAPELHNASFRPSWKMRSAAIRATRTRLSACRASSRPNLLPASSRPT